MKKYYTQPDFKKYNSRRAKRSNKRRLDHLRYLKVKHRAEHKVPKRDRKRLRKSFSSEKGMTYIKAPRVFSLIQNTEECIQFINKLERLYKDKKGAYVLMEEVTELSYGAIVVLLSICIKFKAQRLKLNGSLPTDMGLYHKLVTSGFFNHLYQIKAINLKDRYSVNHKSSIITHAQKGVDSELSAKLISEATQTIWGTPRRCPGVQRSLIELMMNTNNHAVIGSEGEKHWWLSIDHQEESNKVCFSFIDYGVGIFRSLEEKGPSSKWHKWKQKLSKVFNFDTNKDLLKLILQGQLHEHVTAEYYRGKGLPGINEAFNRNQINDLNIITNDVSANVSKSEFRTLRNHFSGTFVYWELSAQNDNKPEYD